MKKLIKLLSVIVLILVVVLAIVYINIGKVVTTAVNTAGPKITQTEVTLEDFSLNIFTGKAKLTGLFVGNPEGYKTASAIELDSVLIELSPASLFSDTIVVNKVLVDAPKLTLEQNITGGSNLKTIGDNAAGGGKESTGEEAKEEKEEEPEEEAPAKEGKKVIIEQFLLTGGQVTLSIAGMQGLGAPLPLPNVELTDIGKEDGGATPVDIVQKILGAVIHAATGVVTGTAGIATDAVKGVGSLLGGVAKGAANIVTGAEEEADKDSKEVQEKIKEVEEDIQEGLDDAVKSIKGLLGN